MTAAISRRGLLIGAALGGGVLVAWGLSGGIFGGESADSPLPPGRDEIAFNAWIKVAADGMVTIAVPQLEMGQGVSTILPQVAAVEMGADWRMVAVEPAPIHAAYANLPLAAKWAPLWLPLAPFLADEPDDALTRRFASATGFAATADGTSLAAFEAPLRDAAATVRALLAMAAADRWGVDWETCSVADGHVSHGRKRLGFGALAAEAAAFSPPDPPQLRPKPAAAQPGRAGPSAFPRLDLPSKANGSHVFAGDVRLPGMVHAAIRHGPLDNCELLDFDEKAASGLKGLVRVVRNPRWLAVVAESWWTAERAIERMDPVFKVRRPVSSEAIETALDRALRKGDAVRIHEVGDPDGAMGKPSLVARYDVAPAVHATLETASATARLRDGRLELWVAAQSPGHVRRAAADALGMAEEDVILYPMPAGGSFDRRLEHDHAVEAALIAQQVGRPVQLTWSRWQEMVAGRPRAPAAALMSAQVLGDGTLMAWRTRIACPPTAREFGHRLFGGETSHDAIDSAAGATDRMAIEGAVPVYGIADLAVDYVPASITLPTGRMRGNAHGYTAFFTESFIDEVAALHRREPLSYRMALLGGESRMAACLQQAARLAQWGGGADGSGQGLACHRIGDGRIAAVVTASQTETGIIVSRISAAVDIGRIVNGDIARQQVEGGLLYGLDLALGSTVEYARGLPVSGRLAGLGLAPFAEAPEIAVEFIASDTEPADPGELGVAVVAPAIANALFSATGLRFRRLPLLSGGL